MTERVYMVNWISQATLNYERTDDEYVNPQDGSYPQFTHVFRDWNVFALEAVRASLQRWTTELLDDMDVPAEDRMDVAWGEAEGVGDGDDLFYPVEYFRGQFVGVTVVETDLL